MAGLLKIKASDGYDASDPIRHDHRIPAMLWLAIHESKAS